MRQSLSRSEKGFISLALIGVVAVVIMGVLTYVAYKHSQTPTTTTPVRTKPGIITSVQFATSLDAAGKAVSPRTSFSPNEKTIYVVAGLNKVTPATRIAYTRYLNDKFVDNGSIPAGKPGASSASFSFTVKNGAIRPSGTYNIKLYTNGAFEKEASFTIQ